MTLRWMMRGTTVVSMNLSRALGTGTELPFTTRFRCLMENLGLAGHCQPVTLRAIPTIRPKPYLKIEFIAHLFHVVCL